jgi:diaminohydroxyphosphoribosylaminopyrimidine deaminase/5-amino-6-(5-phosphoribosylamino)uracil reductase
MVGAVVASGGDVLGRGWHAEYGGDHAEVVALREAGSAASGATLYVNLEPCDHVGNTPACSDAIRRAGIQRVVVACRDPHSTASGGVDTLRAGGVAVDIGIEGHAAKRLNAGFLWRHATGSPFGTLKLALSLDGKLGVIGVRSTVSGSAAWGRVHEIRAAHDAILIGRLTADIDDPRLTVRGDIEPRRPPIRVVLDPSLRLAPRSRLAQTTDVGPVWVFTDLDCVSGGRARALADAGVEVVGVSSDEEGRLCIEEIWTSLVQRRVDSVLVEGGGQTAAVLLGERCIQRMHLIVAPRFFGDLGVPAFPGIGPVESGEWEPVDREVLGSDTHFVLEHTSLRSALEGL